MDVNYQVKICIPEGFELVGYQVPKRGDYIICERRHNTGLSGRVDIVDSYCLAWDNFPCRTFVIRKKKSAYNEVTLQEYKRLYTIHDVYGVYAVRFSSEWKFVDFRPPNYGENFVCNQKCSADIVFPVTICNRTEEREPRIIVKKNEYDPNNC